MATKLQVETLRARINTDRKELMRLEDELFEQEILPAMRSRVGFCYKYRNCYSCPQDESDYWWMYLKIVGVRERSYRVLDFATDSHGTVQIQERCLPIFSHDGSLSADYQAISHDEFTAWVKPLLTALTKEAEHR